MQPPQLPAIPPPYRRAVAAETDTRDRKVSGRVRKAILAMVYDGLTDNKAAVLAGLTINALRLAMKTAHVRGFYVRELEVRRTNERGRNIQRLTEIRDAANNMPAVNAIKMLEEIDAIDQAHRRGANSLPGLAIVIVQPGAEAPKIIEHHDTTSKDQ